MWFHKALRVRQTAGNLVMKNKFLTQLPLLPNSLDCETHLSEDSYCQVLYEAMF